MATLMREMDDIKQPLSKLQDAIIKIHEYLAKACFAAGLIEAKVVEEVFERFGPVLNMHIGGQVIATTHEHPFFVYNKGWLPANRINVGDFVLTEAGDWKQVEEVFDTGEWQPVYNLRIADHHTYFVGDGHWGWAAWAHNACDYYIFEDLIAGQWADFKKGGNGRPFVDPVLGKVTGLDPESVKSQLPDTPKPGSVLSNNIVSLSKYTKQAFGEWLERQKVDALGATRGAKFGWPNNYGPHEDEHAHHIVIKAGSQTVSAKVRETQKILQKVGIDPIFGQANLVWAPNWHAHRDGLKTAPTPLINQPWSDPSNPSRPMGYAESVWRRLSYAVIEKGNSKHTVGNALQVIARDFIQGKW